ncbi:hypothetical protein GQ53DRAFT_780655 [Thozetella sp. PMI_491]|nr:hypothetical protein GQ53DRAFT_780655 [Thozetella sp. PMI_491]
MFIGITGSICAGRESVAEYLINKHGFVRLYVVPQRKGTEPSAASARQLAKGTQDSSLVFESVEELLEHVTKEWRRNWVTTYILSEKVLDQFIRRPFFLLVSVDAPLTTRWKRYQSKRAAGASGSSDTGTTISNLSELDIAGQTNGAPDDHGDFFNATVNTKPTTLEHFASISDAHLYDPASGKLPLISRATLRLVNSSSHLPQLYAALDDVDLLNEDRLRPSWDSYFMALASLAAQRSNCMKRRVGCVVVRDKRVISTGYNGTPRGLPNCAEGGCPRCNQGQGSGHGLATCLCLHAEENALLEAGRDRVHGDAVLYCDTCPCLTCSIKIVQVGIREVVYSQEYSMDGDTATVFMKAGVKFRKLVPPASGHIHLENILAE